MDTEADTCRKYVVPKLEKAGWDTIRPSTCDAPCRGRPANDFPFANSISKPIAAASLQIVEFDPRRRGDAIDIETFMGGIRRE